MAFELVRSCLRGVGIDPLIAIGVDVDGQVYLEFIEKGSYRTGLLL